VRPRDPIPALKDQIAHIIVDRLDGWTQANAAALLGTDQPRISDLRHNDLDRFSLEQLIRFAARIGGRIDFTVTWDPRLRFIAARFTFAASCRSDRP
jgi:predicted XRE-type DNA-binding protein